jgi:hypothetical protein
MIELDSGLMEREDLPSASSFERFAKCPGSWRMERACPEEAETSAAASGTRVHSVLAGLASPEILINDEAWIVERCRVLEEGYVSHLFPNVPIQEIEREAEVRQWYFDENGQKLFSGKKDVVYRHEKTAVVIDYKSGYRIVKEPQQNRQLRALAVLEAKESGAKHIYCTVIQPRQKEPIVRAYYDESSIRKANELTLNLLTVINTPDAPLEAGEHCSLCPARAHCPTAIQFYNERTRDMFDRIGITQATPKKEIIAKLAVLTPEDRSTMIKVFRPLESIGEAVKAETKSDMITGRYQVPGYEISTSKGKRTIKDPAQALSIMRAVLPVDPETNTRRELTPDDARAFLTGSAPKLEKWFVENTGRTIDEFAVEFDSILDRGEPVNKLKESK